ncbi:threonine-rich protein-like [Nematostella vectensis]|uniref:threonine-rich protein-like n=1 Tax=Nematostella vectensis TaxID=45351 RepID=UPI002076E1D7|nr:threonine-rich protein-like [Nematostella vectensis]
MKIIGLVALLMVCAMLDSASSLSCHSCAVGVDCTETPTTCDEGKDVCVTVNGTIDGSLNHFRGCAMNNQCSDCTQFMNASDCKIACCNTDNCNAKPAQPDTDVPPPPATTSAPPPPTTTAPPATTSPPTTTDSPPTTAAETLPPTDAPTEAPTEPPTEKKISNAVTETRDLLGTPADEGTTPASPGGNAANVTAPINTTEAVVTAPVAKAKNDSPGTASVDRWMFALLLMGATASFVL